MKKNSSLILIIILLVLSGVSVYVYKFKSRPSTVNGEERNFSFKDTAAITKIFIADREGHKVTLDREKASWIVDGKFSCRSDAILNLMELIKNVEVKMPVSSEDRNSVIKFMSANAYKIEIYAGSELVRQFYVGHETPDSEGSYMLLTNVETGENYKDPFVCFIPGFKGYLAPRVIVTANEWRDRVVLNYTPPQIKEISVLYPGSPPDSSFTIGLLTTNSFKLTDMRNVNLPFDEGRMKQYLAYYQNISYEVLITGKNKRLQDSLNLVRPFCIIKIATVSSGVREHKFYRQKFEGTEDPEHGIHYDYDPDRLYMRFADNKEWALIQYFVFGKLFVTPDYFSQNRSVKK